MNSVVRVVHLDASRALALQPTGVQTYVRELMDHVPASAPDVQFVWYAPAHLRARGAEMFPSLPANVQWQWLTWPPRFLWTQLCLARAWAAMARVARHEEKSNEHLFFAPGHVAPFFSPRNLVVTVHDVAFDLLPRVYSWRSRFFLHLMTTRNVARAVRIITISQETKAQLVARYGVAPERIFVTPLALPCALKKVTPAPLLPAAIGTAPFVLAVGRVEWKKGADELVTAFERAAPEGVKLVLAGPPGVGYASLARQIASSSRRSDIIELGYVSEELLAALYTHARVCVVASRYEGFGMHALEAFHFGAPLVARHCSAIPEVVGDSALLFTTQEEFVTALSRALSDEQCRAELRERARAQQFSWERVAHQTMAILQG